MEGGQNSDYTAAAFLTRLFLGVMFLAAGIGKFVMGYSNYVAGFTGMFSKSWVPSILTTPVVYIVPVLELVLGILLIAGLWSDRVLIVSGITLIAFGLGALSVGQAETLSFNGLYLLMTAFALYLRQYDKWKIGS